MAQQAFPCPFKDCKSSYAQERNLKQHLIVIREGGYDERHPQNDEQWKRVDNSQYLVRRTRPGLSDEENAVRRFETQRRSYEKHKASILEHQKKKREQIHGSLGLELSKTFKSVHTLVQEQVLISRELYETDRSKYELQLFLGTDEDVTLSTFPRLVVYFLLISRIPKTHDGVPTITPIIELIHGTLHYREISQIVHPDIAGDTKLQQMLDDGWNLWNEVLQNDIVKDAKLFDYQDEDKSAHFKAIGPYHEKLADMLFEYTLAVTHATELLNPPDLSLHYLSRAVQLVDDHVINGILSDEILDRVDQSENSHGFWSAGSWASNALETCKVEPSSGERGRRKNTCQGIPDEEVDHNVNGIDFWTSGRSISTSLETCQGVILEGENEERISDELNIR
jgi:hypothetical protein